MKHGAYSQNQSIIFRSGYMFRSTKINFGLKRPFETKIYFIFLWVLSILSTLELFKNYWVILGIHSRFHLQWTVSAKSSFLYFVGLGLIFWILPSNITSLYKDLAPEHFCEDKQRRKYNQDRVKKICVNSVSFFFLYRIYVYYLYKNIIKKKQKNFFEILAG